MATSKTKTEQAGATETAEQVACQEIPQSLDEFCARLSVKEPRYTLIAAFWHRENDAGHKRDIPSAYAKRYADFLTSPLI